MGASWREDSWLKPGQRGVAGQWVIKQRDQTRGISNERTSQLVMHAWGHNDPTMNFGASGQDWDLSTSAARYPE